MIVVSLYYARFSNKNACAFNSSGAVRPIELSVPLGAERKTQEVGRGVEAGDPPLEDDPAGAGYGHSVAPGPRLTRVSDEFAMGAVVLYELLEVVEPWRGGG